MLLALSSFHYIVGLVRGFLVPGYPGPKIYGVISLLHLVEIVLGFSNMSMGGAYFRLVLDMKGKKEGDIQESLISRKINFLERKIIEEKNSF